jgi:hypothetical protein
MKSLLVLLAVLPLLRAEALAQYRKSFAVSAGGGYGLTLLDRGSVYRSNRAAAMQMAEMSVKAGYYITPRLELGGRLAGCGALNADVSAIYLSLAAQYDATPRLFVGAHAGLPLSMGGISEGFIGNVDLGYRVWQHSSGWSLNASLGYRFMDYAYAWYDNSYLLLADEERFNHGLYAGFCLEYTFASTLPQNERAVAQRRQNRRQFWLTELVLMLFGRGASR